MTKCTAVLLRYWIKYYVTTSSVELTILGTWRRLLTIIQQIMMALQHSLKIVNKVTDLSNRYQTSCPSRMIVGGGASWQVRVPLSSPIKI